MPTKTRVCYDAGHSITYILGLTRGAEEDLQAGNLKEALRALDEAERGLDWLLPRVKGVLSANANNSIWVAREKLENLIAAIKKGGRVTVIKAQNEVLQWILTARSEVESSCN